MFPKPIANEDSLEVKMSQLRLDSSTKNIEGNPIGNLKELCDAWHWPPPVYNCIEETGPPHEKVFIYECKIFQRRQIAKGISKKLAQKLAAQKMWIDVQEKPIRRNEVSKILDENQSEKKKVARMPKRPLYSSKKSTNNQYYNTNGYVTPSGSRFSGQRSTPANFTGGAFSKFSSYNNAKRNSHTLKPVEQNYRKNQNETRQRVNEQGHKNETSSSMAPVPSLQRSSNRQTKPMDGGKLISLQEITLLNDRNIRFKAMGAKFKKESDDTQKSNYEKIVTSNSIGCLQEMCAKQRWPEPKYEVVKETGPSYKRQYTIVCKVDQHTEIGKANCIKHAKKLAAHRLWSKLKENPLEIN